MTADLFACLPNVRSSREEMAEGAVLLRGFVGDSEADLLAALREIVAAAPFRRMFTPGGHQMSVAMTNCGSAGWVTDRSGYRYDEEDPETGKPWPAMPPLLRELADRAAISAGFAGFAPEVCLINRYVPGAKMSLASGQGRTRFRCADRLCLAGPVRDLHVRRLEAERQTPPLSAGARRYRGVGRAITVVLSRCRAARRRQPSRDGSATAQSDVPQNSLTQIFRASQGE